MAQGRDTAYVTASKVMVDNLALTDGQEGIRAFIEKRRPVWSHKAEKAHDWQWWCWARSSSPDAPPVKCYVTVEGLITSADTI